MDSLPIKIFNDQVKWTMVRIKKKPKRAWVYADTCICTTVPDRDLDYFTPGLLPRNCYLHTRPYDKPCNFSECTSNAIVFKVVELNYDLVHADFDPTLCERVKIPLDLEDSKDVNLCLHHFLRTYHYHCPTCAIAWNQKMRDEDNMALFPVKRE